jgi:hypothetical protein
MPLDLYVPGETLTKAQKDVDKLIEAWAKEADVFSRSSRATQQWWNPHGYMASDAEVRRHGEIDRARADGIDSDRIQRLEVQNRLNSAIEQRAALEQNLVSILQRTRTSYETYQDSIAENNRLRDQVSTMHPTILGLEISPGSPESLRRLDVLNRSRAQSFLTLERSLGSGPSSFAQSGIDPRTTEGARYLADFQVRQEVKGSSVEDRIRIATEAALQIQREMLKEIQDLNRAFDNINGVLPVGGWNGGGGF